MNSSLFERLERTTISNYAGLMTFLSIVFIRYQLEMIFESRHAIAMHPAFETSLVDFIHVLFSWATVYLLLVYGLVLVGGKAWQQSNRIALFAFPMILIPPIIDPILGTSGEIAYQFNFDKFIGSYINLFNPFYEVDYVTLGVRVEIFVAVTLSAIYIYDSGIKNKLLRSVLVAWWCYSWIFVLGFLPAIQNWLLTIPDHQMLLASQLDIKSVQTSVFWYLPFLLLLTPLWLYKTTPILTRVIVDCLRPSRLLIYLAIASWGFLSSTTSSLVIISAFSIYDVLLIIMLMVSIAALFVSLTAVNDLNDIEIDKLSNDNRMLASGAATKFDYRQIAVTSLLMAVILAFVVAPLLLFPLLTIYALGLVYSVPPLRLRNRLFISNVILTVIALLVFVIGSMLIHQNLVINYLQSNELVPLSLLFFIGSHFKDIKDAEADRLNGVTTVATIIGQKAAYWSVGAVLILGLLSCNFMNFFSSHWSSWLSLSLFTIGWVVLRNAEKLFYLLLICFLLVIFGQK